VVNRFLDASGEPTALARVRIDQLQYRVRFRYPVDQLVKRAYDPASTVDMTQAVNPATQYLLDTPVFDDISVVYFSRLQFLDFREVLE
jgi:hypothetical protein